MSKSEAFNRWRTFAVVAALLVTSAAADAQTFSWTQPPTGTSANWSVGPWTPCPLVGSGSNATILNFNTYAGSGDFTFTNNIGPFTVNGMNLSASGPNTLTLAATNTIIFAGTDPFLANNGPGNVVISGSGGLN